MNWMRRVSAGDQAATTGTSLHAAITSTTTTFTSVKRTAPILSPIVAPDPHLFNRSHNGSTASRSPEFESEAGTDETWSHLSTTVQDEAEADLFGSPASRALRRWTFDGRFTNPQKQPATTKTPMMTTKAARRAERISSLPHIKSSAQLSNKQQQREHRAGWRDISTLASPNATSHAIRIPETPGYLQRTDQLDRVEEDAVGAELKSCDQSEDGGDFVFDHYPEEEEEVEHWQPRRHTEACSVPLPWTNSSMRRAMNDAHAHDLSHESAFGWRP
ncbi:hypothetical protein BCR37DRAFT_386077 [Protomyces lactucae-debilis]|uniref:Uncharacterized protein n=1 Tax=Protomyces lactucae-debilis TaxID=2754530 RepID=A0A1Y2FP02_PROLT|nr:uncharacterized protein BCR37DRAFT_386077 [Protomyces lactucae-debilis]ORY85693.1 hypothetical protein BCR37DRAFT_386077 [Protomyces lactucae-debilis]